MFVRLHARLLDCVHVYVFDVCACLWYVRVGLDGRLIVWLVGCLFARPRACLFA